MLRKIRKECYNSNNINEYVDLASKLKNLQNMRATVIHVVVGAPGTVPKGLAKYRGGI